MKYQARLAPARLVFIDETWMKTNMAPLRGWCPKTQRLFAKVPHGHWKTMTFLAALIPYECGTDLVHAGYALAQNEHALVQEIHDGPIEGRPRDAPGPARRRATGFAVADAAPRDPHARAGGLPGDRAVAVVAIFS